MTVDIVILFTCLIAHAYYIDHYRRLRNEDVERLNTWIGNVNKQFIELEYDRLKVLEAAQISSDRVNAQLREVEDNIEDCFDNIDRINWKIGNSITKFPAVDRTDLLEEISRGV